MKKTVPNTEKQAAPTNSKFEDVYARYINAMRARLKKLKGQPGQQDDGKE